MRYFTFDELLHSGVAEQNYIVNLPFVYGELHVYQNLTTLVGKLLDPIRERFAVPMIVTSGYRCQRLNELLGGAVNSQHRTGMAIDFYFSGFTTREMTQAFLEIEDEFDFDQLICYRKRRFMHISYNEGSNRHEAFIK